MPSNTSLRISLLVVICGMVAAMTGVALGASHAGKQATRTPLSDVKWTKSPLGVEVFAAFGDASKGPHLTYIKFTPGQKTPVHTHSADYTGVVVSGTGRHHLPGKPETQTDLPAGSTWFMPADLPHISECMPGAECIFAVYQQGPNDFIEVKQD
jgi:quercetin dioxygenase-like cupin family protein